MQHLRSYHLAVQFYRACKGATIPCHLKSQLLRASSSIALNISEGTGKNSKKDQVRFFSVAMGSIRECQAIIELESNGFSVNDLALLDYLGASVYKLIRNSS